MFKKYIWNPPTCSCKNCKYLASSIDDSVVTSDEINEETKTVPTILIEKMCKTRNFLLAFLLITIVILIAVSIYIYLIKYKSSKNIYYHITSQITN